MEDFMHIESHSSGNNTYIRLAEGVSVVGPNGKPILKKKILLNLGNIQKYDDGQPDYLQRLRDSFSKGEPLIPELLPFVDSQPVCPTSTEAYLDPKNLGYLILDAIFDGLEISSVLTRHKSRKKVNYDLPGLAKLLVHGRILHPQSKIKTFDQRDDYTFKITEEEDPHKIYYSLDELAAAKSALLKRLNTVINRRGDRRTDLTYYDVTYFYFEIDENDPDEVDDSGNVLHKGLRKKGVSKENRKQPLVQMGLLIDREGLPVSYDLYPGNTLDHSTFQPSMERFGEEFDLGRIIVVADRGMINFKNILALKDNGYVMSKSIKKCNAEEKSWAIDQNGFSGEDGDDFRVKSRVVSKELKDENGKKIIIKQKQLVYWSRRFYNRELRENESFLKMLEEFVADPNRFPITRYKGLSKFIETCQVDKTTGEILNTKAIQFVKEEKVKEFCKYFGYYMIVTSETEEVDDAIIDIYRGLTRIESCFRTIKSEFRARPIHVKREDHIEAHFLICYLALTIMRLLQREILREKGLPTTHTFDWEEGLSGKRVQTALSKFRTDIQVDGTYKLTRPTEDLDLILTALNIQHPGANCSYSDLIQFKNQLKKRIKEVL